MDFILSKVDLIHGSMLPEAATIQKRHDSYLQNNPLLPLKHWNIRFEITLSNVQGHSAFIQLVPKPGMVVFKQMDCRPLAI